MAYRPDGRHLATAGDDHIVRIWDGATGEALHPLAGHRGGVRAVAYRPDGRHLATAGDGGVRIWDGATGEALEPLAGHTSWVNAVAYRPDGRHLATAGPDGVRIWDSTTGELLQHLTDHTHGVRAVAYRPDGHHLATAGDDVTVRIWDTATGRPAGPRMSLLPDGEVAVFDAATDTLTGASPGAWRWLGWVGVEDGELVRLPAETFGELPPLAEPVRR